jgi:hypothetical protein
LSKEFHDLSIGQNDVLQIEGHRTRFLLHYVSKCIHIPFCNPAADAQLHNVVDNNAVDSPGQFKTAEKAFGRLLIVPFLGAAITAARHDLSKPLAIRNYLKKKRYNRHDLG